MDVVSIIAAAVPGVLAAVGSGITAGLLFCVAFTMVPTFAGLPADEYVALHERLGRNVDRVMPAVVLTSTALDVVAAVVRAGIPTVLFAGAAVCLFGVSVVSHLGNVPINRRVRSLAGAHVPPDWTDPRPRWRRLNLLRTAFGIAALALNCIAVAVPA
jgi:uncharacterized membrane protein